MPRNVLSALLVFLGLNSGPTLARELLVEAEVLHVGGLLSAQEFDAMLADAQLSLEVLYSPTRLIDGVTATRQRTMPIGSRLFAIPQYLKVEGAQITKEGRRLSFRLPEAHPEHPRYYRLNSVILRAPVAPGAGRPQPDLDMHLLQQPPDPDPTETLRLVRGGVLEVGLRVRYRWSDAPQAPFKPMTACTSDIHPLGNGEYRFRQRHPAEGLHRYLSPVVSSDPPSRPPPGQRSLRLREPYPEPVTGWRISRNHLVQLQIAGRTVERFSVYAEQPGGGKCRRTRAYDALFSDGQPVVLERGIHAFGCDDEGGSMSQSVGASWLEDGSLATYGASTPQGSTSWDAFDAAAPANCATSGPRPAESDLEALIAEMRRFRDAFLAP